MKIERKELIDAVNASPEAVKIHDKNKWLSLFSKQNIVEDPVGSKAHVSGGFYIRSGIRGNAPLESFYDAFIAPNDITFHVSEDIVCGYHVMRDLFLQIFTIPSLECFLQ